jgi:hypothetical protein
MGIIDPPVVAINIPTGKILGMINSDRLITAAMPAIMLNFFSISDSSSNLLAVCNTAAEDLILVKSG